MELDPRPDHRPTPMPLRILHEDPERLAIDKPAGLLVIPDRFDPTLPTLFNGVWHHLLTASGGDLEEAKPRLVHRLDRGTSGVILFARTLEAQRRLSREFEQGRARKTYLALVDGSPDAEGLIDLRIGRAPKQTHRTRGRVFVGPPGAKAARTRYRVIEHLGDIALLEVRPETGRTHQIRVHLSAIGHPLVVDHLYGARTELRVGDALIDRLSLHARRLVVDDLDLEAPIPDDFAKILDAARSES